MLKHVGMPHIPKCCVLERMSKKGKGGLPWLKHSDLHIWTQKQVRYNELMRSLGSELFDMVSNSDDDFVEVKEYLSQLPKKKSCSKPVNDARAHGNKNTGSGVVPSLKVWS